MATPVCAVGVGGDMAMGWSGETAAERGETGDGEFGLYETGSRGGIEQRRETALTFDEVVADGWTGLLNLAAGAESPWVVVGAGGSTLFAYASKLTGGSNGEETGYTTTRDDRILDFCERRLGRFGLGCATPTARRRACCTGGRDAGVGASVEALTFSARWLMVMSDLSRIMLFKLSCLRG